MPSSTWGLTFTRLIRFTRLILARCTDQTWDGCAVLGTDQGLLLAMSL